MDAYPADDRELDAMHPFEKGDEDTVEVTRQRDYEDIIRTLQSLGSDRERYRVLEDILMGEYTTDEADALRQYAKDHGMKSALRVVWETVSR